MINKAPTRPIVIRVSNVTKRFGRVKALKKISFDVKKGHIHGFLGPNGAGKTTTIKVMMDFLRANEGKVQIFGLDTCEDSVMIKKRVGYLAGDFDLYENLTGKQYLKFIAVMKGVKHIRGSETLIRELGVVMNKKIGSLSRGNKQKIALVAAMMGNPDLLILDEPTTGLDPIMQQKFYKILHEFARQGKTVFMSSHILSEVQEVCDVVTFMRDGEIIETTSVSDMLSATKREITLTCSRGNTIGLPPEQFNAEIIKRSKTKITFRVDSVSRKVLGWIALQPIIDILITEPSLEEVFKDLYREKED